jgi:hypothetical protein
VCPIQLFLKVAAPWGRGDLSAAASGYSISGFAIAAGSWFLPQKLRGEPPASGVEGLPETGCPLDPGPGLGGDLSVGLFWAKASFFLREFPDS